MLNLQIDLPDAVIPVELLGEGYDKRKLRSALRGLSFLETEEVAKAFQANLVVIHVPQELLSYDGI